MDMNQFINSVINKENERAIKLNEIRFQEKEKNLEKIHQKEKKELMNKQALQKVNLKKKKEEKEKEINQIYANLREQFVEYSRSRGKIVCENKEEIKVEKKNDEEKKGTERDKYNKENGEENDDLYI